MIAILNTGLGNMRSVANAFEAIGRETVITDDAKLIKSASHLVLPGVGSYAEGMRELRKKKLADVLHEQAIENKKPLLGICLGMQLFSTSGNEGGPCRGLDFIEGQTELLDNEGGQLRLPHVGWNEVLPSASSRLFRGVGPSPAFYFVHSYHFKPAHVEAVAATCEYGRPFAAAVESGNIAAVQFHPEKSHDAGLQVLKNFTENF